MGGIGSPLFSGDITQFCSQNRGPARPLITHTYIDRYILGCRAVLPLYGSFDPPPPPPSPPITRLESAKSIQRKK